MILPPSFSLLPFVVAEKISFPGSQYYVKVTRNVTTVTISLYKDVQIDHDEWDTFYMGGKEYHEESYLEAHDMDRDTAIATLKKNLGGEFEILYIPRMVNTNHWKHIDKISGDITANTGYVTSQSSYTDETELPC